MRWLAQHIAEPDSNAASQQMRLESDKHPVSYTHLQYDPQAIKDRLAMMTPQNARIWYKMCIRDSGCGGRSWVDVRKKMFFCRVCKASLRIWPGKLFSVVAPGPIAAAYSTP